MRYVLALLLALVPFSVQAQETDAKPAVNWVEVESTGSIGTGVQGALEKTIWKDAKRTDIELLLQKLPVDPALRSVMSLQRRLLLSKTDSSLIQNDVGPLRGNDLLIQRINKLMHMGLYDDAWDLYTQKAEDPYDVSIAQLGMLLLVMKNDLATACLEEKVFSSRYPSDAFFKTMDKACADTLGSTGKVAFDSAILQSVYNTPSYGVSATGPDTLMKMTDLERALILAKGKIRYDGLNADTLSKTPPMLLSIYLMDKTLPDTAKAMIIAETNKRGLTKYISAAGKDEAYKKAKTLSKDPEDQWPLIESALKAKKNPADLIAFGDMIAASEPENLSTETVVKVLGVLLSANKELSSFWLEQAQKRISEKPIIYIYLQAFKSLTTTENANVKAEDTIKALNGLKPADSDQIIAIIESLDKQSEILNNPLRIYEKHSGLTLSGDYVMPTVGLNVLLETAPEQKQIGITVLAVLNSLYEKPENMYSGTVRKTLYSMLSVGLIEDAKMIGSEIVAGILNKY